MRVATTQDGASGSINGVLFATANVGGVRGRVSEHVTPEQAERLLAIDIFQPFDDPSQEEVIEAGIAKLREAPTGNAAKADTRQRTIDELTRANNALREELAKLTAGGAGAGNAGVLEARIAELVGEVARLTAANAASPAANAATGAMRIAEIEGELAAAKSENAQLSAKAAELEAANAQLSEQVAELTKTPKKAAVAK